MNGRKPEIKLELCKSLKSDLLVRIRRAKAQKQHSSWILAPWKNRNSAFEQAQGAKRKEATNISRGLIGHRRAPARLRRSIHDCSSSSSNEKDNREEKGGEVERGHVDKIEGGSVKRLMASERCSDETVSVQWAGGWVVEERALVLLYTAVEYLLHQPALPLKLEQ